MSGLPLDRGQKRKKKVDCTKLCRCLYREKRPSKKCLCIIIIIIKKLKKSEAPFPIIQIMIHSDTRFRQPVFNTDVEPTLWRPIAQRWVDGRTERSYDVGAEEERQAARGSRHALTARCSRIARECRALFLCFLLEALLLSCFVPWMVCDQAGLIPRRLAFF